MKRLSGKELARARQKAAERYSAIGEAIVSEAGVQEVVPRKTLSGRANTKRKRIYAPWPTTTKRRLFVLAHECGHVVLHECTAKGYRRQHAYVQEYEAEQYAIAKLREHGVAVPKVELDGAKKYVGRKIEQAIKRGAKRIDPKIRAWAWMPKGWKNEGKQ